MAELIYDKTGRLLFTKEMKEEYTILFPTMLPVHFGLIARIIEREGYKLEMLTTNKRTCSSLFALFKTDFSVSPSHLTGTLKLKLMLIKVGK